MKIRTNTSIYFTLIFCTFVFCGKLAAQEPTAYWDANSGKYGYKDQKDKTLIQPQFADARDFSDGMAAVLLGETWGYIDLTGKIAIPPTYIEVNPFGEGLAAVCISREEKEFGWGLDEEWIFIDKTGKKAIDKTFDRVSESRFSEGLCAVVSEETYSEDEQDTRIFDASGKGWFAGYINKKGETVIPFVYQGAGDFTEGIAKVGLRTEEGASYGFIDKIGKLLFPLIACDYIEGDGSTFKKESKVKVVTYDEKTDQSTAYYINRKGEKVK